METMDAVDSAENAGPVKNALAVLVRPPACPIVKVWNVDTTDAVVYVGLARRLSSAL